MTSANFLLVLKRLSDHVKRRATGSAAKFARRMGLSRATFYRYLDVLRTLGAEIKYDSFRETYYYERPPDFTL